MTAARRSTTKEGTDVIRYKILLVDDEADHRKVFQQRLEHDGFSVMTADNGASAFDAAVQSNPDLIISDVAMPNLNGHELCRRLKSDRRTRRIPVIMMSGVYNEEEEQLEGLEEGADDYLPKSYSARLLAAKIRGILRRFASPAELRETLKIHGLALDVSARTVTSGKRRVALTRKEFDLLTTFLRKPGQVLTNNFLLETVWNYDPVDYNDRRTIQTHVYSLRRKLGNALGKRITSVSGLGYRFD